MRDYNLSFITNENLYAQVKEVVESYDFNINLKKFNKNLIDPIKLTFDAKVQGKSIDEIIESEIIRQMDKTISNSIGYFHQNIFKYIGSDEWSVPTSGFDIVNENEKIFVEMKNKHNTMNSGSAETVYRKMLNKYNENNDNTCYLVEIIAKNSQNIRWDVSLQGVPHSNDNIKRISIDKFYELVTGESDAFKNIVEKLPMVIDDVLSAAEESESENTVVSELAILDENKFKSLYLLSFGQYQNFDDLNI